MIYYVIYYLYINIENTFPSNAARTIEPGDNKTLYMEEYNYLYATLDNVDIFSELVDEHTETCHRKYIENLPIDWIIAPPDRITLTIIEENSFSGAHCVILSDYNAYRTKLGREQLFLHATGNTIWDFIEGRLVEGNDISENDELTLEECQELCAGNAECKSIQFPDCILKSSAVVNITDDTFQYTTYIKLNEKTSIGTPIKCNPDNYFVNFYEPNVGLKVPESYCPGRILIRKKRSFVHCNENGHYYEFVHFQTINYNKLKSIVGLNKLYHRGVTGHLAVITSEEENSCIETLCDNVGGSNKAWIGAENNEMEWKWTVNNIPEYNKLFIDDTQSIVLGTYAPELKSWNSYQSFIQLPSAHYSITVCDGWNIEKQSESYGFIMEYELPVECDHTKTLFEILGPEME